MKRLRNSYIFIFIKKDFYCYFKMLYNIKEYSFEIRRTSLFIVIGQLKDSVKAHSVREANYIRCLMWTVSIMVQLGNEQ